MDFSSLIWGAIPVILGVPFIWGRLSKVLKALKELGEVFEAVSKGLADKKLTSEEIDTIKREIREAIVAFKAILK